MKRGSEQIDCVAPHPSLGRKGASSGDSILWMAPLRHSRLEGMTGFGSLAINVPIVREIGRIDMLSTGWESWRARAQATCLYDRYSAIVSIRQSVISDQIALGHRLPGHVVAHGRDRWQPILEVVADGP